jgi:formate hydrogenlyase transcriptional activator
MARSRIKPHQELHEPLPFERLLAEISTFFINLPANRIDDEINAVQKRVCKLLDIDRSALWLTSENDPGTLLLTNFYQPPEIPSPPARLSANDFWPWTAQKVLGGETVAISKMSELPEEAIRDRESYRLYGTRSVVVFPLSVGSGEVFGLLTFAVIREERDWPETVVQQFELVAQIFANALARKRADEQLKKQLVEIEDLKQRLEKENLYLREELREEMGFEKIIGSSDELKYVLFRVRQAAPTDATVLILGETGTGKGMVAHAIHGLSRRKDRPMVTVNCAALPANLIESELFGREKGAFTGSYIRQAGRFEIADKGTIFLDEIGELPQELQSKLLRVLQDGEFERLGSAKTVKVDVRVIAATSRDLKEEVSAGKFREDLFYRINVFPVSIPPLRKRTGDIAQLVRHFVDKYARKSGKKIETVPKDVVKALQRYSWPGNVRELEHVIERAVIITEGPVLQIVDYFQPVKAPDAIESSPKDMAAMEREHILRVLRETNWIIGGPRGAASILNIHPSTLRFRIKKLGIQRP